MAETGAGLVGLGDELCRETRADRSQRIPPPVRPPGRGHDPRRHGPLARPRGDASSGSKSPSCPGDTGSSAPTTSPARTTWPSSVRTYPSWRSSRVSYARRARPPPGGHRSGQTLEAWLRDGSGFPYSRRSPSCEWEAFSSGPGRCPRRQRVVGDPDRAFAPRRDVVEGPSTGRIPRNTCYPEPQGALAAFDYDKLVIRCATQWPFHVRDCVAVGPGREARGGHRPSDALWASPWTEGSGIPRCSPAMPPLRPSSAGSPPASSCPGTRISGSPPRRPDPSVSLRAGLDASGDPYGPRRPDRAQYRGVRPPGRGAARTGLLRRSQDPWPSRTSESEGYAVRTNTLPLGRVFRDGGRPYPLRGGEPGQAGSPGTGMRIPWNGGPATSSGRDRPSLTGERPATETSFEEISSSARGIQRFRAESTAATNSSASGDPPPAARKSPGNRHRLRVPGPTARPSQPWPPTSFTVETHPEQGPVPGDLHQRDRGGRGHPIHLALHRRRHPGRYPPGKVSISEVDHGYGARLRPVHAVPQHSGGQPPGRAELRRPFEARRFRSPLPICLPGRTPRPGVPCAGRTGAVRGYPFESLSCCGAVVELELDPWSMEPRVLGVWLCVDGGRDRLRAVRPRARCPHFHHGRPRASASGNGYPCDGRPRVRRTGYREYGLLSLAEAPPVEIEFLPWSRCEILSEGIGELPFLCIPAAFAAAAAQASDLGADQPSLRPPEDLVPGMDGL
ncbi:MAG: hypothetical protein MZU97_18885 [Bacillus subtilis]|nr:hypothetical protein [Bacillus subtilis]